MGVEFEAVEERGDFCEIKGERWDNNREVSVLRLLGGNLVSLSLRRELIEGLIEEYLRLLSPRQVRSDTSRL